MVVVDLDYEPMPFQWMCAAIAEKRTWSGVVTQARHERIPFHGLRARVSSFDEEDGTSALLPFGIEHKTNMMAARQGLKSLDRPIGLTHTGEAGWDPWP